MFVVIDESFNLQDKTKPRFISINGFTVLNIKSLTKKWKNYRLPFTKKGRRIHATDSAFVGLRDKTLQIIARPDITLITAFQVIQEITLDDKKGYFKKGKLNFEKVYFGLLTALLSKLEIQEYRAVKIILDSRKYKSGIIGKKAFQQAILSFLNEHYPKVAVAFKMQSSTSDISLELADFISNLFYRAYISKNDAFFEDLKFKIIQIKNPL
ncbi:MAG: hypothetical protein A2445_03670 [Candidatus Jacksonbacteria bacterium RIFOXYC2_FULL_44_29]|nr:MAG: hypothetical protein UV19_C0009G0012 [Parcubacteria group bacterium GW2011_GWA2_42_28]KKT53973.1 MAG: hypothetical protein UW45_C0021G0012 [Parcubacteria group bacterium GW2011_GWC2_44_22]OGY75551.1 MAG: hypothetical protein A2295_02485 [Candidatus Jacksonbacteria bacterium RIFOXYB2_FULL_44_15]OGY75854.1 MAG: hypothetical protein A2240_01565 [Candidatus Jacksonbacteria bacterium RIFOXYA2_FULL_43_12]OGY77201.1 MAG: hypothetical protein A2445_03670 [Candidatus Jacksonbacteria bacterium RI